MKDEYDHWDEPSIPSEITIRNILVKDANKKRKQLRTRIFSWQASKFFLRIQPPGEPKEEYTCDICQRICHNQGSLASHKIKEHSVFPEAAKHVNTTWCPVCLHFLHTIPRVKAHMRPTCACTLILYQNFVPLNEEQTLSAREKVKETRRVNRLSGHNEYYVGGLVMQQAVGPLPIFINPHNVEETIEDSRFPNGQNIDRANREKRDDLLSLDEIDLLLDF